jgi:hypothetical protein
MPMSAFSVPAVAGQIATPPLLLVHDRLDSETGWSDSAAIARVWPVARLVTTSGLGHRRILRDPAVVAEAAGFVTGAGQAARLPDRELPDVEPAEAEGHASAAAASSTAARGTSSPG